MTAYVLFTVESVADRDALQRYRIEAGPSLGQYGGRFLAGSKIAETLEGPTLDSAVLVAFDDVDAARRWYNSPEYQSHVGTRHGATTGRAVILQDRVAG